MIRLQCTTACAMFKAIFITTFSHIHLKNFSYSLDSQIVVFIDQNKYGDFDKFYLICIVLSSK